MNGLMLATYVLKLQLAQDAEANRRGKAILKRLRAPTAEAWLAIAVIAFGMIAAFAPVA
jgi:hypothetical protein